MTWLAPYYEARGWTAHDAGLLLAGWSVAQIPAALLVPVLAERRRDGRGWTAVTLACGLAGTLGVLVAPELPVLGPWPWVLLLGVGAAGFALGLAMIAWRSPGAAASASVSGFALGVGYTVAGLGPLLMGVLVDLTGGFTAAVAVLLAGCAAQAWGIRGMGATPDRAPGTSAARTQGTARDR